MDRELLDAELKRDEGEKLFAYDDSDGSPIRPGHVVKGNVTAGVGINLSFLYPEESIWLLHNRQDRAISELKKHFLRFDSLDEVRQRAITNLYFNVPKFLTWPRFMRFCGASDWEKAAGELENTHPWIDQVGARGYRIAAMLRTGKAVIDITG